MGPIKTELTVRAWLEEINGKSLGPQVSGWVFKKVLEGMRKSKGGV
ncbi:MAG TPA: hypothetical protein VKB53_13540 [Gammaproteobacteria bacterium]|nr:hypothetical protein [Gammaproteobacteria bacterium]